MDRDGLACSGSRVVAESGTDEDHITDEEEAR